jgi:hypothetical protein
MAVRSEAQQLGQTVERAAVPPPEVVVVVELPDPEAAVEVVLEAEGVLELHDARISAPMMSTPVRRIVFTPAFLSTRLEVRRVLGQLPCGHRA